MQMNERAMGLGVQLVFKSAGSTVDLRTFTLRGDVKDVH